MAWTYSGDPSEDSLSAIRFLIGDTVSTEPLVSDEEIEWALSQKENNVYSATALVARALAARFATLADEEIGPLKFKYVERAKNYGKIAAGFEQREGKYQSLNVFGGGIFVSDRDSNAANTSIVQPSLYKGQFDVQTDVTPETSE